MSGNVRCDKKTGDEKMGTGIEQIIIGLIKRSVAGVPLTDETKSGITTDVLKELYVWARKQDVYPLIADAIRMENIPLGDEVKSVYEKADYASLIRYERMKYDLAEIEKLLNGAKIAHLPLKGAVVRELYPKKEYRLSSDIDILIHTEDLQKTEKLVISELHFEKLKESNHDYSYRTVDGVSVEIHYGFIKFYPEMDEVLKNVWEQSVSVSGDYTFAMPNDLFVYYHLAHLAKHFLYSGFGIRSLIDLYVMTEKGYYDKENVLSLCKTGQIDVFAKEIFALMDYCFYQGQPTEQTEKVLEKMLYGSLFGNEKDGFVYIKRQRKKSKLSRFFSHIFPSYTAMKSNYPVLSKCPILLPFVWIRRWLKIFSPKKRKEFFTLQSNIENVSDEQQSKTNSLLTDLGLERFLCENGDETVG